MDIIDIACDHAGYDLKEILKTSLQSRNYDVRDWGTYSGDSVDYPDFAHRLAQAVTENKKLGVLICGSGNGVCMSANKHKGIRAALCWTKEIAELARLHNDANVLCIPARFISSETASEILEAFLSTEFEGGRHARRVNKIDNEA